MAYSQLTERYTAPQMVRFCENAPIVDAATFEFMAARPECPPSRLVDALGLWELARGRDVAVPRLRGALVARSDLCDAQLARVVCWRHLQLTAGEVAGIVAHRGAGFETLAALGHVCVQRRLRAGVDAARPLFDAMRAAGPLPAAAVAAAGGCAQLDVAATASVLAVLGGDAAAEVFTALCAGPSPRRDVVEVARVSASAVAAAVS